MKPLLKRVLRSSFILLVLCFVVIVWGRLLFPEIDPFRERLSVKALKDRGCDFRLWCLWCAVCDYAGNHDNDIPLGEGPVPSATQSLEVLRKGVSPDSVDEWCFECPEDEAERASGTGDGQGSNHGLARLSYTWRRYPYKLGQIRDWKTVLSCDNAIRVHDGLGDGIFVLYASGKVEWFSTGDLGPGGIDGFMVAHKLTR